MSLVTSENGSVVEQTFYEPFGKVISGGTASRFQYESKEYSSVVGDYDFHARKVNPDWGVFTQPDTIIQNVYDPQSLNRYAFERNNPVNRIDENGQASFLTHGEQTHYAYSAAGFSEKDAYAIGRAALRIDFADYNKIIVGGKQIHEYRTTPAEREDLTQYWIDAVNNRDLTTMGYAEHGFLEQYYHENSAELNNPWKLFGNDIVIGDFNPRKFLLHTMLLDTLGVDATNMHMETNNKYFFEAYYRAAIAQTAIQVGGTIISDSGGSMIISTGSYQVTTRSGETITRHRVYGGGYYDEPSNDGD